LAHKRFIPGLAFLAVLLFSQLPPAVQAQQGGLVIPRNLMELVEEAETIVVGRVLTARTEPHPQFRNLDTVVVTLRVDEAWKGSPGQTFSFRQYVWDFRDAQTALGYKKGQEVLLLMIRPSRYGLSSPAGLQQGRFRVVRDSQGRRTAINAHGNHGLFRQMAGELRPRGIDLSAGAARLVEMHRAGAVDLEQLRGLVRQLKETQ